MTSTEQLAKHLHDLHFGGNWTCSNLKDQLNDVSLEQALQKVGSLNTIAALTFHINYYVKAVTRVLNGKDIAAHDKFSYTHPDFTTETEWKTFVAGCLNDAEQLASLIQKLDDSILNRFFVEEKYGTYYRNFLGLIEHSHYHLGQIAVIKKLL